MVDGRRGECRMLSKDGDCEGVVGWGGGVDEGGIASSSYDRGKTSVRTGDKTLASLHHPPPHLCSQSYTSKITFQWQT